MSNKKMKRTQVFLPESMIQVLDDDSKLYGISKGEIIRTAIFYYYKQQEKSRS